MRAAPSTPAMLEPCPGGAALVDRSLTQAQLDSLFIPDPQASQSLARGRGQAWRVHGDFGSAALRHYNRGGLFAPLLGDRYWFTSAEGTRSFAEYRLLQTLQDWQLPAPKPIAARYLRQGLLYRADLLTAWLPGARPLSDFVQKADSDLFAQVGETIARFHGKGVDHADLNAHNVVITDAGVALLDFDRGQLRKPGAWLENNLERLKRSLTKLGFTARADFSASLWPALCSAHVSRLKREV